MDERKPLSAPPEWRGRIAAHWTLVESFEVDGTCYLLAQRKANVPDARTLSPRQQQAVARASLGYTNKVIAYEMGITPSTVGVLLHRAAKRLRATSRVSLIALYLQAH